MSWTEERVSTLKTLWAEGLSAAQIAKQLGGVTRNAVIGKVHRLGLAGRATPSRPAKRPPRAQRPRTIASPAPRPRPPAPALPVSAAPSLEALRREDGSVATVLTINDRVCKWPIGDPSDASFAFCGRPSCSGPYCQDHARVAYQPQQPRKKKPFGGADELRRMLRLASI